VSTPSTNVPVGVASKTGYAVAATGLIGAVLAYLTGDHSQAQLGSILSASVGAISLAVTQIGRYVQANSQIHANAELSRQFGQGAAFVRTIEQYDPGALAQVEALVRGAVRDEIARLSGTAAAVATDPKPATVTSGSESPTEATDPEPATGPGGSDGPTEATNALDMLLLPTEEEEAAQQPPAAAADAPPTAGA
jgi:hypothetical protein